MVRGALTQGSSAPDASLPSPEKYVESLPEASKQSPKGLILFGLQVLTYRFMGLAATTYSWADSWGHIRPVRETASWVLSPVIGSC